MYRGIFRLIFLHISVNEKYFVNSVPDSQPVSVRRFLEDARLPLPVTLLAALLITIWIFFWYLVPPHRGSRYFSLLRTKPSARIFLLDWGMFGLRCARTPNCFRRLGRSGFSPVTRCGRHDRSCEMFPPRSWHDFTAALSTSTLSSHDQETRWTSTCLAPFLLIHGFD